LACAGHLMAAARVVSEASYDLTCLSVGVRPCLMYTRKVELQGRPNTLTICRDGRSIRSQAGEGE
jgi:hypothetical protein